MALCLVGLLNSPTRGWFTAIDGLYFCFLAATVLGRWVEFQGGEPRTAVYEPATPAHLRRYLICAPLLGAAAWIAVKLFHQFAQ